ncbi:MAG: glycoside hydrolase family 15 protein [Planctomycetota bacterium]
MPRDIPVGNGDLLVTFDDHYRIRDLYYPRVGQPNHTDGHIQRFGVWADGQFAWVEDETWTRVLDYEPDTLLTRVTLRNETLGIEMVCCDVVDHADPIYFRRCVVRDIAEEVGLEDPPAERDVRLFFHFDLSINGNPVGDTTNYDPDTGSLVLYKDDSYFLINAHDTDSTRIDSWSIGTKRLGGAEGTWRDAEDGVLGRNTISQGSVDATVAAHVKVPAGGEAAAVVWMACGHTYREVRDLNARVCDEGSDRMINRTAAYWRLWVLKENADTSALPDRVRDLYYRSALVLRTQVDNGGAIIAANDTDIAQFGGDHYSYCWPRDGALCAHALILTGQSELSRNFFRFAARVIEPSGYFLHKYNPSGTLASSWHPWTVEGERVLPIQQDETALTLWALRQHFDRYRDVEFVKSIYQDLVIQPADWMLRYRDANGLPQESWDLWEERRGISTFCVGATIGAFRGAAEFCREFGELDRAGQYDAAADTMIDASRKHLYHQEQRRFCRMATPLPGGGYRLDMTPDSSNYALWAFGGFDADSEEMRREMSELRRLLSVSTEVGGLSRYARDYYHQIERDKTDIVPGNPWVICTLWQAQHEIAKAKSKDDLREAMELIEWCTYRSRPSGVLAEQFHPYTGEPISVSPLTWSHATIMIVVAQYLQKLDAIERASMQRRATDRAVAV